MTQWWIHIDLAGIQRYVYQSRTLLDGIGRAAQVDDATNPDKLLRYKVLPDGVQVLFGAAGALILAVPAEAADDPNRPPQRVRTVVGAYTRWLYELSSTLTPVVAIQHVPDGGAAVAHRAAADLLRRARHGTVAGLGGAVPPGVLRCVLTGAPADAWLTRDEREPVSTDALNARDRGRRWHEEQQAALLAQAPLPGGTPCTLPTRIDQLGRTETVSSHVAVLVLDVNDLGAALRTLPADDLAARAAVADHLRALADELAAHLVHRVCTAVDLVDDTPTVVGGPSDLEFSLHHSGDTTDGDEPADEGDPVETTEAVNRDEWMLPIRPWVVAGDDLVLVCESRLAWDLATAAMDWIGARAEDGPRLELCSYGQAFGSDNRLALTLGIGIAVVPVGYSLAAAHDLAAGLCKHAKKHRRKNKWPGHVVDWHRGPAPVAEVLATRSRSDLGSGRRPYHRLCPSTAAHAPTSSGFTWDDLMQLLDVDVPGSLRSRDGHDGAHGWAHRRSWVKTDLLAAARSRSDEVVGRALAAKTAKERALTGTPMSTLAVPDRPGTFTISGSADLADLLVDAIDLLDDHLQVRAVERTAR
ncbi:hypothetical protein [Rhodococcus ruber]|uniref:hypothetical protein n=1 Tax=Rhodococcus ruber TaxID=1830 RepID=UPI000C7E73EB|nr:hypothetical protein [Rhodococcus ruber]AUM20264.1 hypothetical protein CSW53_27245 [Rhodococcus ruber]